MQKKISRQHKKWQKMWKKQPCENHQNKYCKLLASCFFPVRIYLLYRCKENFQGRFHFESDQTDSMKSRKTSSFEHRWRYVSCFNFEPLKLFSFIAPCMVVKLTNTFFRAVMKIFALFFECRQIDIITLFFDYFLNQSVSGIINNHVTRRRTLQVSSFSKIA